jgi:hypothetical protein
VQSLLSDISRGLCKGKEGSPGSDNSRADSKDGANKVFDPFVKIAYWLIVYVKPDSYK